MTKYRFIDFFGAVVLLFLFESTIFSADSGAGQKRTVSFSGYFQIRTGIEEQAFSIPFSKLFLDTELNEKLSAHLELRPLDDSPLGKAYLNYFHNSWLNVSVGQISNPIKRIEPQPENHEFNSYALYRKYVANPDDIGLAVHGKRKSFYYYLCLINGTGRNVSDNNTAKDLAGYVSFAPTPTFFLELAGQIGKQPDITRSAGFIRTTLKPLSDFEMQLAGIFRGDLDERGWYVKGSYFFPRFSLNARFHRTKRRDKPVWTISLQTKSDTPRLTVEVGFGKGLRPSCSLVLQLNIGKR